MEEVTRSKGKSSQEGFEFPTQQIELPSGGKLYPPENPLSKGVIDIRYMTAKDEEILSTQSLIEKGLVFDRLLKSIVVTPGVNIDDLVIGDKNAVLVSARILGFGPEYKIEIKCPKCGKPKSRIVDLTTIPLKEINMKLLSNGNKFKFECPISKHKLEFKLLTHGDEMAIDRELRIIKQKTDSEVAPTFTTTLRYMITSVNGKSEIGVINSFINNEFLSRDVLEFRKTISSVSPDVDMKYHFTCDKNCERGGDEITEVVPITMGVGFFWPSLEL